MILPSDSPIILAGQAADRAAANNSFADYRNRKAGNTTRRQDADLKLFSDFLAAMGAPIEQDLATDPAAWTGISWGLVEAFVKWQEQQGYALDSINVRLSTVKRYAQLALKAGTLGIGTENSPAVTYAMIREVKGYAHKEKVNIDSGRKAAGIETRRSTKARMTTKTAQAVGSHKKTAPIFLNKHQREALAASDGTPQGIRDALIVCLMVDHGLRVSEVAGLQVADIDTDTGFLHFYRPKTQQTDTHRLTPATLAAAKEYMKHAPDTGNLWRSSAMKNEGKEKQGELTRQGLTTNAIYKRVELLGRRIHIDGLSPHDLRHTFAERARNNRTKLLQTAGGWSSEVMPLRYQKSGAIANDGLILED
jgi:integrase